MKQQHRLTITINGGFVQGNKILYFYSTAGEASVILTEQAATILFTAVLDMDSDDTDETSVRLFRDAYRKIHLIHLFATGETIHVSKIEIRYDEDLPYCLDSNEPGFPFVVSMLEGTHFRLGSGWRNEALYDKVSQWPINAAETDLIHCAVSAFLSAQTRRYPGDQLLDLWTAMNSYYSHQAICFERTQAAFLGVEKAAIPSWQRAYGLDAVCMTLCAIKEFGFFFEKHSFDASVLNHECEKLLTYVADFPLDQLETLYKETASNLENFPTEHIPSALYDLAVECHIPLHLMLIFHLPYYLRCELIHGSRSIPILYRNDDPHVKAYRVSSFYLQRFLDGKIPEMFAAEDSLSEPERDRILCALRARDKKKLWLSPEDAVRLGLKVPWFIPAET